MAVTAYLEKMQLFHLALHRGLYNYIEDNVGTNRIHFTCTLSLLRVRSRHFGDI